MALKLPIWVEISDTYIPETIGSGVGVDFIAPKPTFQFETKDMRI